MLENDLSADGADAAESADSAGVAAADAMAAGPASSLKLLDEFHVPALAASIAATPHMMTVEVELPPGSPGTAPHRHSGPVCGYMVEGAMVFELEGEAPRVLRAGEAFHEPGGDVIHYQAANHLPDARSRFVAVMMCAPGQPMLTFVDAAELTARAHLRHPGPLVDRG